MFRKCSLGSLASEASMSRLPTDSLMEMSFHQLFSKTQQPENAPVRVRFSFPSLCLKIPLLLLYKIRGIILWCVTWGARVSLFEILVSVLKKLNESNDQVLKIPVSARWFPVLCFQKK